MSQRHFEWAAQYIQDRRFDPYGELSQDEWEVARFTALEAFIAMFRRFGPCFDEPSFRAACQERLSSHLAKPRTLPGAGGSLLGHPRQCGSK